MADRRQKKKGGFKEEEGPIWVMPPVTHFYHSPASSQHTQVLTSEEERQANAYNAPIMHLSSSEKLEAHFTS